MYTTEQKLACIERELRHRRRVYARLVDQGKMTEQKAEEEISMMEAIKQDYQDKTHTLFSRD
ncbi:MAG: hypothetical protein KDD43_00245 [Bdellovibrionales bacterium]|nr:hypothetical protein [Bdellovibrionales bacterium]